MPKNRSITPRTGVELLAALQTDDEVGLEQLHLVVLHELAVDPRHHAARVDDHEVRALGERSIVQARERPSRAAGDDPAARWSRRTRGASAWPSGRASRSSAERDVLQADGARRTDRLLAQVAVDVGDRPPNGERVRRDGARERALPGVQAPEEHGPCARRARLGRRAGRARSRTLLRTHRRRPGAACARERSASLAVIRPRCSARSGSYRCLPRGADSPFPP